MSSIQERLQLKRVPLDTWNIREQLCLASAVMRSGDQNWMSVSRSLKTIGDPNRPPDWYSQKSCAAQYGALLENVETPKRKKRSSEGAVETPQESILKKLTQERIIEINKAIVDINLQCSAVKSEIAELRDPSTSEERVKELWSGVEAAKRAREKEQAKRVIWLREREERHARAERNWRPATTPATPSSPVPVASAPQPSSPLLSSLLKSSPVVTTPQHIPHPATVVETISPSAGAPTLSMLLDKRLSTQDNEHAAIEHIKSEIVQLAKQLKASSSNPQPIPIVSAVPATPSPAIDKIEIDDIEIKAEDVYAFSDIDIEIPPVSSIHSKAQISRNAEKLSMHPIKKEDEIPVTTLPSVMQPEQEPILQPKEPTIQPVPETEVSAAPPPVQEEEPAVPSPVTIKEEKQPEEEPVKISFPEVKFPKPEIKVIAAEQPKVKEVKLPEILPEVAEPPEEVNAEAIEEESLPTSQVTEQSEEEIAAPGIPEQVAEESPKVSQEIPSSVEVKTENGDAVTESKPEDENAAEESQEESVQTEEQNTVAEVVEDTSEVQRNETPEKEVIAEEKTEANETLKTEVEAPVMEEESQDDVEESMTLQEVKEGIIESQSQLTTPQEEKKEEESSANEEVPQDTDDDTPMELIREEEKDGKKKRDYSRKRKYDSRTWSGSESAPESPVSGDADKQHKMWKKSVMLVHSRLCAHKFSPLFTRPITNELAPNYHLIVKKPMDLHTIKKHIDAGIIRTTREFHRCILLMLSNALFYNSFTHDVHRMTREMHREAEAQIAMLLQAQAHADLPQSTSRSNKRRSIVPQPPSKRRREQ